jgi:hypothetical protein
MRYRVNADSIVKLYDNNYFLFNNFAIKLLIPTFKDKMLGFEK